MCTGKAPPVTVIQFQQQTGGKCESAPCHIPGRAGRSQVLSETPLSFKPTEPRAVPTQLLPLCHLRA